MSKPVKSSTVYQMLENLPEKKKDMKSSSKNEKGKNLA